MCVSNPSERFGNSLFESARGQTSTSEANEVAGTNLAVSLLSGLILGYRWLISPWIGPRCRFLPTCSEYALDALSRHGAIRGGWLTVRRLIRCHPWGGSGFDPVPCSPGKSTIDPAASSGVQPSETSRSNSTF